MTSEKSILDAPGIDNEDITLLNTSSLDMDDIAIICDARDTICGFCTGQRCNHCPVAILVNEAHQLTDGQN